MHLMSILAYRSRVSMYGNMKNQPATELLALDLANRRHLTNYGAIEDSAH
jgi:hypothetical protein